MNRGFTTIELLITSAITLAVTAALLGLVQRAQSSFRPQPEHADLHQRLRAAADALTRDVALAGAGLHASSVPSVVPYRIGAVAGDADAAGGYRSDTVSVSYVAWGASNPESHTYYLRTDPSADSGSLMHYDGQTTDLPVVDGVVALQFEYFGTDGSPIDPARFQDGPWVPEDPDAVQFDADLLEIRRVRVAMRMHAHDRSVPDEELRFDIAVRNVRARM
jgi:Tfp pilus assembly protein PilW